MNEQSLINHVSSLLEEFCIKIPTRRLGSTGNQSASKIFDDWMRSHQFSLERQLFDCQDWEGQGAVLTVYDSSFSVFPSPHSLGCEVQSQIVIAQTIEELHALDAKEKILLLRGSIASTQLMPTNYPFYYPDEHREIYEALEAAKPAAIITATAHCPEIAGAQYPVQMIEDGNFDIPSVYMTEEEGERLSHFSGQMATLKSIARRIDSQAWNSIAHFNPTVYPKVMICAHIDAKPGSPGALDNATGIITLMLLGSLLKDDSLKIGVDIVSINGEDHYEAKGEMVYFNAIQGQLKNLGIVINIDGLGFVGSKNAFSLYNCEESLAQLISQTLNPLPSMTKGSEWYQGDHTIFVQQGIPAIALTSDELGDLMSQITHTPADSPDKVDPELVAQAALSLKSLIRALDSYFSCS